MIKRKINKNIEKREVKIFLDIENQENLQFIKYLLASVNLNTDYRNVQYFLFENHNDLKDFLKNKDKINKDYILITSSIESVSLWDRKFGKAINITKINNYKGLFLDLFNLSPEKIISKFRLYSHL